MEGFLEANRLVEVSLNKLNRIHKTGDLPLRKTLLVSKVLNTAQEVATSAHLSFIRSPPSNSTRSSKLLASISQDCEQYTNDESLPLGRARPAKAQLRQTSPIASAAALSRQEPTQVYDDSMDFLNVGSVLSDILLESDPPHTVDSTPANLACPFSEGKTTTSRSKLLDNISNTQATTNLWSAWQFDLTSEAKNQWRSTESRLDCSPGKRNHEIAFSLDKENTFSWNQSVSDNPKRFKPSTPEGCPLESLPGFCGHLSPKSTSTYMFSSGFSQPSDSNFLSTDEWPLFTSDYRQEMNDCDLFATFAQPPMDCRPHPILAF